MPALSDDFETRIEHPQYYWCHAYGPAQAPVEYFWNETPVTREEYLKYSNKIDCQ